ncbi:orotate phosphoribosyltransferase [Paenibacillus polymyxa]|jgi:orotate phosphoribosyltransferase|uniref:orotate phosphoribosyltransferase n=1 Tax=Paenibacillus polymyxa TaxID=1406 RepID=UPI00157FBDD5|nr:orotate phosphoribosyltransferase [Paenibacillus polymyxa]MBY0022511.1 orotate phosphoribosyltransferase [Paenibacillus polymyxa]MBY0056718.1 orotate phosphoribosyltransferase [Paenibacillus polymyxa]MBY0070026.1 orotate phosphoribosyltransferase [Paenibacillus polymyxa]MBY0079991.1 orotate phosphoribosyltransferase [Paenibacillus polymyxa]MBZ6444058.1 orotate phosphoribosyltransferase [Paenibacillus polymyxa]
MTTLNNIPEQIASHLLRIQAVALRPQQPFTWTSGIKSPIYCDNRLTMSYPEVRELIADSFAALIREQYPETEVIAGTATAGIPHAAWVAQKLNLPMAYVRDKAKGHGKENQIEGRISAGQKVIVIEDLISTGGSSIKAAQAVEQAGAQPLAVLAIFSYQLDKATQAFEEAGVKLQTLSNYTALMEVALREGTIQEEEMELLRSWRQDPASFGK